MIITADMERVDEQIRPGEESAENVAENHVYKHIHVHVIPLFALFQVILPLNARFTAFISRERLRSPYLP